MIEINNTTKFKLSEKLIKKTTEKFLASRRLQKKNVSIAFIGDARMRALNKKYRKKDKTTDVLSFEGGDNCHCERQRSNPAPRREREMGDSDLGEILINPAQIKRQAKENNNSFEEELIFILVHGLLHLAGYGDETEKDRLVMIKIGEMFISKFKT
jgi:probable rRNA maturation factor